MSGDGDFIFPEDSREIHGRKGSNNNDEHASAIPANHVLRDFFAGLVKRKLHDGVGVSDQDVCVYVANLLTEFCEAKQMYKIRDAVGRSLHDVGEMLIESDPVYGPAPSF